MSSAGQVVLVTGASGYLAAHVVQQLQAAGYKVRGTVRSLKNEEKVAPLRNLCPGAKFPLELVEANLLDAGSWEKAVEGCTYVVHTASPFPVPGSSKDPENEIIKPAVEGTTSVINACIKAKVKRVVLTSSMAAIAGTNNLKLDKPVTEDLWTEEDKCSPYTRSKTIAERTAWEIINNQPDGEKTELSAIHPGFILGPPLSGGGSTSIDSVAALLSGKLKPLPPGKFSFIDVRDVAKAHVVAMTLPAANGKRHILVLTRLGWADIASIMAKEFNNQGYDVETERPKGDASELAIDNSRLREVLNIKPRSPEVCLVDMGYSLIETGRIAKTDKYKGVPKNVNIR